MKKENIEKVEQETADWGYMETLPPEWFGFRFRKDMHVNDDMYELYSYHNEAAHRSLNNAGRFALPPSRVEALYAPEMFGAAPNAVVQVRMAPGSAAP